MHPQLIPERHPKCGKLMEALVQCRKDNPVRKYWGVCNEITWQLTTCLKEEKLEARAPRQAKFHERYAAKRKQDQARMEQLEKEYQERLAAKAAAAAAESSEGVGRAASVSEPRAAAAPDSNKAAQMTAVMAGSSEQQGRSIEQHTSGTHAS